MNASRRFALLFAGLIAVLAIIGPIAPPAQSTEKPDTTLFLNVTTDDTWTAQMAFGYAEMVLGAGYPVVVFLNVRGVRLADKTVPQERGGVSGKMPREMLAELLSKGATVFVCPSCANQAGVAMSNFIDGAKPGGPETIKIQMAPSTKVMSF